MRPAERLAERLTYRLKDTQADMLQTDRQAVQKCRKQADKQTVYSYIFRGVWGSLRSKSFFCEVLGGCKHLLFSLANSYFLILAY